MGKAKTCPECQSQFIQRCKGCCPHCGTALEYERGRVITQREKGKSVAVLGKFVEHKPGLYFPKGSTAYILQLSFAAQLIKAANKYLNYRSRFELDPTEFVMSYLDHVFGLPRLASYLAEANTLKMLNGNLFYGEAPKVLKNIDRKESDRNAQRTHARNISDIQVPVLG